MNNLDKIRREYEAINASEELKIKVTDTIKQEKHKKTLRFKAVIGSLSTAAAFVVAFNCLPSLANATADIPILNSLVRVVTLGKYEAKDKGYEAKVVTPKVEGLLDKELERKLNEEFKENADSIIKAYEKDVRDLKKEFGDDTIHMGVDSDYIIKTDNDDILALDVYILYTAGSSSTKHTFYNIDKKSGNLLTLNDMFKDGVDYEAPINEYIKNEMNRINNEEDGMFWVEKNEFDDGFQGIKKNQNFYINDQNNIVICFDKYEVAAGAQGCPEFEIPDSVIKNILK